MNPRHVTLRQFRYFIAVAESGSVASASRMLAIAQSALTKSMQELEDELGTRLFERSSRGMQLTPQGHRFLASARKVLAAVADATRLLADPAAPPVSGMLAIGVTSLVAGYYLSELFSRYRRHCPAVEVFVTEDEPRFLEHLLINGELDVAIADLNKDAAQAVASEITRGGGKAIAVAMDVTKEEQVNAAVAAVVREWGGVDVLVSNAGIQIVHPIEEFPFAEWKKMLAIHLDGAFLTTRAVLPHMQRSGRGGSIIYMGSVHSKEASVLKSAYVTAKHGLIGLAKTVAKEGGKHGIRANVIAPGFVRTPLVDKQIPEQARALGISEHDVVKKVMLKDTVDGHFTTVGDVAEVAVGVAGFWKKRTEVPLVTAPMR